jgi:hypothetical protein
MVLGAPMVPCCNRAGREPFILSYVDAVRELALINQLAVADFNRAWSSTCRDPRECELYNLPEGLHPNKVGYDVMGEVALAALLGIDIFRQGGAAELEDMLSLPPGSVVVRPEEVVE